MSSNLAEERRQTDLIRNRGAEDGLFRACMDRIRRQHHIGQLLRSAFVMGGVFTDVHCYTELLAQFYVATKALEALLSKVKDQQPTHISKEMRALLDQYAFTEAYEADLKYLLGNDWEFDVRQLTSEAAVKYVRKLQTYSNPEEGALAGMIILWGPLVIGGGASLYPRVRKAYGEGACNVFKQILGGQGREGRRNEFINAVDSVAQKGDDKSPIKFENLVDLCGIYMGHNNEMMTAVKRRAWWVNYVYGGLSLVVAAALVGMVAAWKKR
mmetsp:Transcript_5933/g.16867  ORF Transcript_5933/g.16867 Transcript_5933/m.16867 type:complete len:269 (+) Transcript_5933:36-842(+)